MLQTLQSHAVSAPCRVEVFGRWRVERKMLHFDSMCWVIDYVLHVVLNLIVEYAAAANVDAMQPSERRSLTVSVSRIARCMIGAPNLQGDAAKHRDSDYHITHHIITPHRKTIGGNRQQRVGVHHSISSRRLGGKLASLVTHSAA